MKGGVGCVVGSGRGQILDSDPNSSLGSVIDNLQSLGSFSNLSEPQFSQS